MASSSGSIQSIVEKQLVAASTIIENQLDAEIERLDNLEQDDLEILRRERLDALKKRSEKKQEWITNGHSQYMELYDEKDFFEATKKSENVVCHFYRDGFMRCKIVDKHLAQLAVKHIETKFCKINVERSPFLTDRLKIRVLPTLCIVRDSKTKDYIVGFTDLGNTDEFTTEMLEWRLAQSGVIEYQGDLLTPPSGKTSRNPVKTTKKTIRGKDDSDTSDDDE